MKIRRYLANNTQEAILKVKMDLGNDALILNTRKVRQKGLFKIFAKPMIEVLAAIDENYGSKKEQEASRSQEVTTPRSQEIQRNIERNSNPQNDLKNKTNFDEKEEKIAILENKISGMESMLQTIYQQLKSGDKDMEPAASRQPQQPSQPQQTAQPQQPALPQQLQQHQQTPQFQQPQQSPQLQQPQQHKADELPRVYQMFYNNLVKNEVDPDIAKKILESVAAKAGANTSVNDTASNLSSAIAGALGRPETIQLKQSGQPAIVIFVGPTGVGKTTTLAKIAASYLLNHKKSVGMITADTYRIAAVEQLKTYAEILGIPVTVVYSPNEIREAVAQHSDKDVVLIDTAGRSHRQKGQFEELKGLIAASGADEVYLVLSATTSIRNCKEILANYDFLKDYKLIFTKTDEAPVLGIVLNVRYLTGKKLSYITTGQSVPDDIEVAAAEKITKNLMGSIG